MPRFLPPWNQLCVMISPSTRWLTVTKSAEDPEKGPVMGA